MESLMCKGENCGRTFTYNTINFHLRQTPKCAQKYSKTERDNIDSYIKKLKQHRRKNKYDDIERQKRRTRYLASKQNKSKQTSAKRTYAPTLSKHQRQSNEQSDYLQILKIEFDKTKDILLDQLSKTRKNEAYNFNMKVHINCMLRRLKNKIYVSDTTSENNFRTLQSEISKTFKDLSTYITQMDLWSS